jgi:hypothetical protein
MISGILVQVLRAPAPWFLRAFTEGNLFGDGKCRELGKTQVPVPFISLETPHKISRKTEKVVIPNISVADPDP